MDANNMQISNLLIIFLMVIIIWNSHVAGAAYCHPDFNSRLKKVAIAKSVFSIVLGCAVAFISWK
jgi:hypothetical protein